MAGAFRPYAFCSGPAVSVDVGGFWVRPSTGAPAAEPDSQALSLGLSSSESPEHTDARMASPTAAGAVSKIGSKAALRLPLPRRVLVLEVTSSMAPVSNLKPEI